ncbi:hypothetical protein A2U01_0018017 [Trifolium medium]|uniref:Uncharacterized protein n=1 Tax=Trifolium medium TaxID=97028 RepID=A0A392NEN2_9FABA|nr:hypothetical protein [Trifolium medium]
MTVNPTGLTTVTPSRPPPVISSTDHDDQPVKVADARQPNAVASSLCRSVSCEISTIGAHFKLRL